MPWLPILINEQDKKVLLHWLNAQEEIAFIVPKNMNQWHAVSEVDELLDGPYSLWHTPSGPLPLVVTEQGEDWIREAEGEEPVLHQWTRNKQQGFIADPWAGWDDKAAGAGERIPNFGVGHFGVIELNIRTRQELYSEGNMVEGILVLERTIYEENTIGRSGFGWIGDQMLPHQYGRAPQQTWEWWERLKQWVVAEAELVAQYPEQWDEEHGELQEAVGLYAFPSAYQALKSGQCYVSGLDFSEELR